MQFIKCFKFRNVIFLSITRQLLTEHLYEQQKLEKSKEKERDVLTAPKIKKKINKKSRDFSRLVSDSRGYNRLKSGSNMLPSLKLFINEIIKNILK